MFSRRKVEEKPSASGRKPRGNLPLLGLEADMDVDDDDEGDEDLEKELAALVGGGARKKAKPKKKEVAPEELNAMVANCMADINESPDEYCAWRRQDDVCNAQPEGGDKQ